MPAADSSVFGRKPAAGLSATRPAFIQSVRSMPVFAVAHDGLAIVTAQDSLGSSAGRPSEPAHAQTSVTGRSGISLSARLICF